MCNLVWFILALELPSQQWVAAIPSWKGQVLWVPFCFILSMVVLEHKVRWSYYLIPVFVGICFTLPNLLCPCCLSSWEAHSCHSGNLHIPPLNPCHHNQLPLHGDFTPTVIQDFEAWQSLHLWWVKTLSQGSLLQYMALNYRGGIFLFSGGDEGPDQLVEILNSLGGLLSDREEWILGQWEGVPSIPVCKLWMRKPGSKSFLPSFLLLFPNRLVGTQACISVTVNSFGDLCNLKTYWSVGGSKARIRIELAQLVHKPFWLPVSFSEN